MTQPRNDERIPLLSPDVFRNQFEALHEPIGGFGVWNGQFEVGQPLNYPTGVPEGWEVVLLAATSYATHTLSGGYAGANCMRLGSVNITDVGADLLNLRYFAINSGRDYTLAFAAQGSAAGTTLRAGLACYDAAKTYLGAALTDALWAPGIVWTRRVRGIGPAGVVAWIANTRYARLFVIGNWGGAANNWIEVDDVSFV